MKNTNFSFVLIVHFSWGFPGGSVVKNLPDNAGDADSIRKLSVVIIQSGSYSVRKLSWRRQWQPTSVFLPGKSHGERSLVDYSPWGHRELDMTERLSIHFLHLSKHPFSSILPSCFRFASHSTAIALYSIDCILKLILQLNSGKAFLISI